MSGGTIMRRRILERWVVRTLADADCSLGSYILCAETLTKAGLELAALTTLGDMLPQRIDAHNERTLRLLWQRREEKLEEAAEAV